MSILKISIFAKKTTIIACIFFLVNNKNYILSGGLNSSCEFPFAGPLCSVCADSNGVKYSKISNNICQNCSDNKSVIPQIIGVFFAFCLVFCFVVKFFYFFFLFLIEN